jgi:hypothetical protein
MTTSENEEDTCATPPKTKEIKADEVMTESEVKQEVKKS